ncbi:MAG: heme exporter protein A [Thiomicrorhabdus sp.]|nr:MAG: heme exporter protein A [Thiomicrorhabdus sp.]
MLSIESLSAEREDRLLFSGVSATLSAGEGMHVIGRNGSGKTTLLRIICGLTAQASGHISWNGEDVCSHREAFLSDLLYLGHKNANKTELSCYENLRLTMGLEMASEEVLSEALRNVGLGMMAHLPARFLSEGQQRRLSMARLLLSKAKLWVLDEPYTALDYKAIDWLDQLLEKHMENNGLLILTSHQTLTFSSPVQELDLGKQYV